ncbi:MAG: hypothetical protein E6I90_09780 [Chloroflexi bacterium]|nr:MAG: hypothetical protein E6I90_09780 [Chloroflexota bacterium]
MCLLLKAASRKSVNVIARWQQNGTIPNDGSTWGNAIASGQGSSAYTVIPFTKQSARYIKVVLTASSGSWWSIDEFYAFS